MKTAKDKIRDWCAAQDELGTRPPLGEPYLTVLSDYPEPMVQVEIHARAAFWPRSLFEDDWPTAERELRRFFIDLPGRG